MTVVPLDASHDDADVIPSNYTAYGDTWARPGSSHTRYAGEVLDVAFGGYLLGGRIYLPWLRRFLAPDPISPFDDGGVNRYAYCLGDPINRIDPSGNASFGWLGKLLSRLGATIGRTVDAVSQITPTTALTAISSTADAVAVATAIGAVTATALDDGPTASILGWIALGSGAVGLGLGTAGRGIGKRTGIEGGVDEYTTKSPPGTTNKSWDGRDYVRDTYPLQGGRQIKRYAGTAAVQKFIPHRKVKGRTNGLLGPVPEWTNLPNQNGGINWVVDSNINKLDELDLMEIVRRNHGDSKKFIYLTGVHGSANGNNWKGKVRRLGEPRFYTQITRTREHLAGMAGVDASDIFIVDLGKVDADGFTHIMDSDAHIVHGYCYSAVDRVLMAHLGVQEKTMRIYRRMRR